MEVLLVEPGKEARIAEIGNDLKSLQAAVGGYIEATYPFDDPIALVCNDEGKIMQMPLNRALRGEDGKIYDAIAGPFFICGLGEDDFCSLPKELQGKYMDMLYRCNGRLVPYADRRFRGMFAVKERRTMVTPLGKQVLHDFIGMLTSDEKAAV